MVGVILAAGRGTRLGAAAKGLPKCMVDVGGKPLIDTMFERLEEAGIASVVVVHGYQGEKLIDHVQGIPTPLAGKATFVANPKFRDWGNFYSLLVAEEAIGGRSFVKLDADVLLDNRVLPCLLEASGPAVLAVDRSGPLGEEEMKVRVNSDGQICALNKGMQPREALGESLGIDRIDSQLNFLLFETLRELIDRGETHEYYERAYELMMSRGTLFHGADVTDCCWQEVDTPSDLEAAEKLAKAL